MRESKFGRKSYGRLKFGIKFGSRALQNSQGLRNFETLAKIFTSLQKISAFTIFVFFSSFSCLIHLKTVTKHSNQFV